MEKTNTAEKVEAAVKTVEAAEAKAGAAPVQGTGKTDGKKVVGIQRITKKDGSGYAWKLFLLEPYSDYDLKNCVCQGNRTSDEYITGIDCSFLKIGDIVKVYKEQHGNFLIPVEIRVL